MFSEYKKIVLRKLNRVLYKLNTIENRIDILENTVQCSKYSTEDEIVIQLPITAFEELLSFEKQLQEIQFKNEAVR